MYRLGGGGEVRMTKSNVAPRERYEDRRLWMSVAQTYPYPNPAISLSRSPNLQYWAKNGRAVGCPW